MGDDEVRAELLESIIVELSDVVRDNDFRNSKPTYNVFPYEIFGVSLCDFGKRFYFYPLCEIVYGVNQKFPLQWSLR